MFLATTRANSINVFKREERIRRWGGISRSKSVINKHCAEILNWIKLQWLVQEAISFPTVPSGKSTKSGVVLKLTLLLRNGSREKYGSNVLMNHSYLGDPFFFFICLLLLIWRTNLFPVSCRMLSSFFSIVLQVVSCQAISFWSPTMLFALKFTLLFQLVEKNF